MHIQAGDEIEIYIPNAAPVKVTAKVITWSGWNTTNKAQVNDQQTDIIWLYDGDEHIAIALGLATTEQKWCYFRSFVDRWKAMKRRELVHCYKLMTGRTLWNLNKA